MVHHWRQTQPTIFLEEPGHSLNTETRALNEMEVMKEYYTDCKTAVHVITKNESGESGKRHAGEI